MLQRQLQDQRRSKNAFWLAAIPGLLGLFGLGHFYLHESNRGFALLAYSGILYLLMLGIVFVPPASFDLAIVAPIMWFVGWVYGIYDVRNLAKTI